MNRVAVGSGTELEQVHGDEMTERVTLKKAVLQV